MSIYLRVHGYIYIGSSVCIQLDLMSSCVVALKELSKLRHREHLIIRKMLESSGLTMQQEGSQSWCSNRSKWKLIFDVKWQNESKTHQMQSWCAKQMGRLQEQWKEGLVSGPARKVNFAAAFWNMAKTEFWFYHNQKVHVAVTNTWVWTGILIF